MFGRFVGPSRSVNYENFVAVTTPGANTFTVPDGVYQLAMGIWGSGGSGGTSGSGGGGGANATGYNGNPGGDGNYGFDGNDGAATTVTRDANSYTYDAQGGKGGYGTQAGPGAGGRVLWGTGGTYYYPDFAGSGDTRIAAAGAGGHQSGNPGNAGEDSSLTPADGWFYWSTQGFTAGDGGGGGAAINYQGQQHGAGGAGGGGATGGTAGHNRSDVEDGDGGPGGPAGGGSGGGSGGFTFQILAVSPGETFTIDVAAGGAEVAAPEGGAINPVSGVGGSGPYKGKSNPGVAGGNGAVVFWY